MPEISRFYGIAIYIYFSDHAPPHFHAIYGGREAVFNIADSAVMYGWLPVRAKKLVQEWAAMHKSDLLAAWNRAQKSQPPKKIPPLD